MDSNYDQIKEYWNEVFKQQQVYDPFKKLGYAEVEQAVEWLCDGSEQILDFGCGSGKLLGRCFAYGAVNICGIDLSDQAIKLAEKVMDKYDLQHRSKFICGGLQTLQQIYAEQYDGVILFNIIDNIKPDDGKLAIKEIHRVLKTNGRVILKLNPYLTPQVLAANKDIKEVATNLYQVNSRLMLWNICTELLQEIANPYFKFVRQEEMVLQEHIHRLFYLQKR